MSLFSPSVHRMHREKCCLSSNTQTFVSTLRFICISPAPRSQTQTQVPIKTNPKQYVIPLQEYNEGGYYLSNSDSDSDCDSESDDDDEVVLYDDNFYDIDLSYK